MRGFRSFLGVVFGLASCGGWAQDQYGQGHAEGNGYLLTVGITMTGNVQTAPNAKVSGTNVTFDVSLNWGAGEATDDNWNATTIVIAEKHLTIGGTEVAWPSGFVITYPDHGGHFGVTFASTHFADAAAIPIHLSVKLQGTHFVSGVTDTMTATADVSLTAYNKGLLLATQMPSVESYQAVAAKAAANIVGPKLEAMNHKVKPKPFDGASSLTVGQLAVAAEPLFREATLFSAVTHGEPTGIYDSFTWTTGGEMAWALINYAAVAQKANYYPPYNFVLLCACATSGATSHWGADAAGAFGIAVGSGDQIFIGFPSILDSVPDSDAAIEKWCARLYDALLTGLTADEALAKANVVRPRNKAKRGMTPIVVGDKLTRLINVYLPNYPTYAGDKNIWFLSYLSQH